MSHQTIKADQQLLKQVESYYQSSRKAKTPQGALFQAAVPGCTITAYRSGKVLFQGAAAEKESSRWGTSAAAGGTASVSNHKWAPPESIRSLAVIGSDETGTGDYFGPITVTAAHLTQEQLRDTAALGLKDSKSITDPEIRRLAPNLLQQCTYSLKVLRNPTYNKWNAAGMNQGEMKALLHHEALKGVIRSLREQEIPFDGVFIDQFVKPEGYFRYLKKYDKQWPAQIPIYFATKAEDQHPAVAAGSILARYAFLKEMDDLSDKAGVQLPKGAGRHVDEAAGRIAGTQGEDALKQMVKWHFSNTKRALAHT
ncbi:ribonuclease HIII [Alkalicoccus chagannorensis]|uniref:ribonuclease HIII n=1 Tax=Alkalicoccus chagannorensis TaxID=427072 RepID=UPI0003F5869E|nr:ribonuclease HIII [Alkalicoccus chagannorensis]